MRALTSLTVNLSVVKPLHPNPHERPMNIPRLLQPFGKTTSILSSLALLIACGAAQRNNASEHRATADGVSKAHAAAGGPNVGVASPVDGGEHPCRPLPPPGMRQGDFRPPPMTRSKASLVKQFDTNSNGRLERAERDLARKAVERQGQSPAHRPAPPGGDPFAILGTPAPGPHVTAQDFSSFSAGTSLYAPATVRTLWLEFEHSDWEAELEAFHDTDVEVPAKLSMDGQAYDPVGVRFRGMSSFAMVPTGFKRSLAISMNAFTKGQRLLGIRSLNLLNAAHDPTLMRTVLALEIARRYLPAPKANHIRVVINGESWGIYVNSQQVNQDFVKEWFGTAEGHWWKVPGSPGGRGSLAYLGEDQKSYEPIYELRSKNHPEAYRDLIRLCRLLDQSKPETVEQDLASVLDIDEALRFLALENLLVNNDGYFLRTSDYYLYERKDGRFVIIPHDLNETFNALEGGPGMDTKIGVELDPLMMAADPKKPLISKLLAAPRLRKKYLSYLREMAETWLDWNRVGPIVEAHQRTIAQDVGLDPRKLSTSLEFTSGVSENSTRQGPCGKSVSYGLKPFVEGRRAYLLNHPALSTSTRAASPSISR